MPSAPEELEFIEFYSFNPVYFVLTKSLARRVLEHCMSSKKCFEYSWPTPWLPRPTVRFCCEGDVVQVLASEYLAASFSIEVLTSIVEGRSDVIYEVLGDKARPVMVMGRRFVKLRALGENMPPTLEIDGIHMHRVEEVDPWTDAKLKVRDARVVKGCRVLDVCTGLGYTALASLLSGAELVVTVELDELVLWAAERNPWSWQLNSPQILLVHGDALEVVPCLKDNSFDRVIHDPPRFSLAGELYSRDFYKELFRVLRPGGVLYHYTGLPGKHSKTSVVKGVMNRLREVGFTGVRFSPRSLGVVARKPRRPE